MADNLRVTIVTPEKAGTSSNMSTDTETSLKKLVTRSNEKCKLNPNVYNSDYETSSGAKVKRNKGVKRKSEESSAEKQLKSKKRVEI